MTDDLGAAVRRARTDRGWTLRRLERATGVHNAHLSQIESGAIARPAPNVLWVLATALELDYPRLLELAGHTEADPGERRRSLAGVALHALEDLTPAEQADVLRYMETIRRRRETP